MLKGKSERVVGCGDRLPARPTKLFQRVLGQSRASIHSTQTMRTRSVASLWPMITLRYCSCRA